MASTQYWYEGQTLTDAGQNNGALVYWYEGQSTPDVGGSQQSLTTKPQSATEIRSLLSVSGAFSVKPQSATQIVSLLSVSHPLSAIIASATELRPNFGFLRNLSASPQSATQIRSLLGRSIPVSTLLSSSTSINPGLSRLFYGGLSAFDVALLSLAPTAYLDTGTGRPIAYLSEDNDNQSLINPDISPQSPDDVNMFP